MGKLHGKFEFRYCVRYITCFLAIQEIKKSDIDIFTTKTKKKDNNNNSGRQNRKNNFINLINDEKTQFVIFLN